MVHAKYFMIWFVGALLVQNRERVEGIYAIFLSARCDVIVMKWFGAFGYPFPQTR
jgi:hypothetical protein